MACGSAMQPQPPTAGGQLGVVGAPAEESDGPRVPPQHVPLRHRAAAADVPHDGRLVLAG